MLMAEILLKATSLSKSRAGCLMMLPQDHLAFPANEENLEAVLRNEKVSFVGSIHPFRFLVANEGLGKKILASWEVGNTQDIQYHQLEAKGRGETSR